MRVLTVDDSRTILAMLHHTLSKAGFEVLQAEDGKQGLDVLKNESVDVVITDINDYRLELARKMGATRAVNVARESLRDVMADLRMTEGFDVGLEMSGVPSAFTSMLEAMNHGGKVALLGIPPAQTAIDWNQVIFKGLEIKGIYGREMFETWYKMVAMLQSGLDLSPIITHRFAADDFEQGFAAMLSGESGKVILDWTT